MTRLLLPVATIMAAGILFAPALPSQTQRRREPESDSAGVRLPSGKLQQDEILKADHEKSIKDAAQLIDLAESLKQDLEKDDSHVLSISSLKKTEEIEKIARRIRTRLKRF
jgi:hypothetical protein